MSNHTKLPTTLGKPIPVMRANVDPLGEAYDGATILTYPAGEHISLSIEFYRSSKASVTMTNEQAYEFIAQLNDALIKATITVIKRQQDELEGGAA